MKISNTIFFTFLLSCLFFFSFGNNYAAEQTSFDQSYFIENKGQWDKSIKFAGKLNNGYILITDNSLIFNYSRQSDQNYNSEQTLKKISGQVVKLSFLNSSISSFANPEEQNEPYFNYIRGNDPSKWAIHCNSFKSINLKNLYNGVDLKVYYEGQSVRYDFHINEMADPAQISMKIEGSDSYDVNSDELKINTRFGQIEHNSLLAYQDNNGYSEPVKCSFTQEGEIVKFNIGKFDKTKKLIIDPFIFSTFWGGNGADDIIDIKNIKYGEFVTLGTTESSDFKTTSGSYDTLTKGGKDVFITKFYLFESVNNVIFSTIVGSMGDDFPVGLGLDADGDIYFAGYTNSNSFPVGNGFNAQYQGLIESFVCKLSKDGTQLLYSSFLGGKKDDYATKLFVSSDKSCYVCGYTSSTDFQMVGSSLQKKNNGLNDCFISKVSPSGKTLDFSTYFGGSGDDRALAIYVDESSNVYLTGQTNSGDLTMAPYAMFGPTVTDHPYDYSYNGGLDVFVSKIISDGSKLEISTYYGGAADERGTAIYANADGTIYVTGETAKETGTMKFPVTDNVYSKTPAGGIDCFFAHFDKVKTSGSGPWTTKTENIIFSTLFGGSAEDWPMAMIHDASTNTFLITGKTASANFPIINAGSVQNAGRADMFLTRFSSNGGEIILSTLAGGKGDDIGYGITMDSRNDIYIAGSSASGELQTINNNIQTKYGGSIDGLIFKYAYGDLKLSLPMGNELLCPNTTFEFKWLTNEFKSQDSFRIEVSQLSKPNVWVTVGNNVMGNSFKWNIPDNFTPAKDYICKVSNKSGIFVSSKTPFSVLELPSIIDVQTDPADKNLCEGSTLKIIPTVKGDNRNYQWFMDDVLLENFKDSVLVINNIQKSGKFRLQLSGTCQPAANSPDIMINVLPATKVLNSQNDTTIKKGDNAKFTVSATGLNLKYEWYFGSFKLIGFEEASFSISGASISNKGTYKCIVKGDCGQDSTFKFTLDVDTTTKVSVIDPLDKSINISACRFENGKILINLTSDLEINSKIDLFNVLGHSIIEQNQSINQGFNFITLNSENLNEGVYFISITTVIGKKIQKIIISK